MPWKTGTCFGALGLALLASAPSGLAQTSAQWTVVPSVGVIQSTAYWGRVPLNDAYDGVLARPGPGLQLGIGVRKAMGRSGWLLEAQVTRSFFSEARTRGECTSETCLLILVRGDLPTNVTTFSVTGVTPSIGSLPVFFRVGVGAVQYHVGGDNQAGVSSYLKGSASEIRPMLVLGSGLRGSLAGIPLELNLTDMLSWAEFGFDRRITNQLALTVGVPLTLGR